MNRFDRYLAALWTGYGLVGVVVVVLLIAFLLWFFGIDVAGGVKSLVNWNS